MSLDVNISEPDEFNCIELHNCIEIVANIYELKDFIYHVDILCGKGENFIANVFRVSIKESESDKNISVIVKTLINTTRQELFRELHNREVIAYRDIIERYNVIQNNFTVEDRIVLPKCIFSSTSKNNEVIILEDLLLSGFELDSKLAKYEKLDYPQVRLIITELAKFHAMSFVYETTDKSFENVRDSFTDLVYQDNFLNKTKLKNYFQESFQMSLNLIADEEIKKKLEHVKIKLLDLLKMYTKPKKYNVFCHGDCWINNILFKNEGTRRELCFLDFQAMRYANPITDILYFMYICTDSEFRSEYFDELKTAYYDTFKIFLKQYNVEANVIYPKEDFDSDIQETLPFGLLVALLELRLVTIIPEDQTISKDLDVIPDSEETTEGTALSEDKLYAIRVNDVVNECINNGVIQNLLNIVNF
ncbi:unnamed protein product, partial [Brenthis ino]